jgi:hypothetical protein
MRFGIIVFTILLYSVSSFGQEIIWTRNTLDAHCYNKLKWQDSATISSLNILIIGTNKKYMYAKQSKMHINKLL